MGLQLKGDNKENNENTQKTSVSALDKKHEDPWGNKDIEDNFYKVNVKAMAEDKKNKAMWSRRYILGKVFRAVLAIIVIVGVVFAGIYIKKKKNPEYIELGQYVNMDESGLSKELGVQLSESDSWMSEILIGVTGTKIKVYTDGEVGVFYFDDHLMGMHIRTDKYKMFGIRPGEGDKEALKEITYNYEDYFFLSEDYDNGATTTYYYYNKSNNNCVGLTKNDATNLIEGITYISNYQYFKSFTDYDK